MERIITLQYTEAEILELFKKAINLIMKEKHLTKEVEHSTSLDVLSSKEVCSLLHISQPTLIKIRREGKLTCKRISGKVYYRKSDVEKYLST